MSDFEGGSGDRPRWEGFPGGVEPDEYSAGPGAPGYEPVPPQFPIDPGPDVTAPMPVVAAAADGPPAPGPRSARHGHAAPRPSTSRYIAIACAAALALIAAGFLFVSCTGSGGTSGSDVNVVPFVSSTPTPTPSPTRSVPTSSPSPTGSASATPSTSASPTSSASASPTGSGSASPSATATAAAVKQPVVVLNGTNITGLAKRVAATVTAGGWTVTKTTNWTGQPVTSTTIYYLPGAKNKASAKLFAKQFDVVAAVKPALPGMTSNLTLVLARDAA